MYQMKTNTIYCGDCVQVLRYFPNRSIDLIYVDPPFFSNKQYEILWGNGYELRAFEDRWKGGIRNYIAWMAPKVRECRRVLKETGSMYLHCDWHANAHLRLLMDRVFGENNFRNEIVWCYTGASSPGQRQFPRKHDTILWYSKGENWIFNDDVLRVPYSESTLARARAGAKGGRSAESVFHGKRTKRTLHKKGKIPEDWWEMPTLGSTAKERLGYPTQKPEHLLERIIKASSNLMDIVVDPMCGGATTIAVAHKLGRRWIGIDVSPTACKVMVKRMRKLHAKIKESDIIGLPMSIKELKALPPFEFQNWVIQKMYARPTRRKVGDFGVDGWLINGRPVQVKQQEDVGRNVVDNFETAMRRQGRTKGIIVAFSFGKGAWEERARAEQEEGLQIEFKTVEELLREV